MIFTHFRSRIELIKTKFSEAINSCKRHVRSYREGVLTLDFVKMVEFRQ